MTAAKTSAGRPPTARVIRAAAAVVVAAAASGSTTTNGRRSSNSVEASSSPATAAAAAAGAVPAASRPGPASETTATSDGGGGDRRYPCRQSPTLTPVSRGGGTKDDPKSNDAAADDDDRRKKKSQRRRRRNNNSDDDDDAKSGDGRQSSMGEKAAKGGAGRRSEENGSGRDGDDLDRVGAPGQDGDDRQREDGLPEPSRAKPSPVVEDILREDDYYRILGLTQDEVASSSSSGGEGTSARRRASAVVTKAYRRRCVQTHPDKTGGDRRAFDKVAEAYDVLSDDDKRNIYNRLGKQGLKQGLGAAGGAAGFADAHDLFRRFFGGDEGGYASQAARRRNRTVRYQLEVTLEDLYKGMSRTVEVRPPTDPWGRPSPDSKQVDVTVPRGAMDGHPIVVSGAMDFAADETPGDLVFIVHERPHPVFVRKGFDLAITVPIRLREAICGVTRVIRHLDGRKIAIGSARHSNVNEPILIQNGDVQVLKGEGMPKDEVGTSFGDLYVVYEVTMPNVASNQHHKKRGKDQNTEWTSADREELGRLLDKLEGITTDEAAAAAHVFLKKAAMTDFGRASGRPPRRDTSQDYGPEAGRDFVGGNQFFFSSSSSSLPRNHPFFGMHQQQGYFNDGDEENMQCRQM